MDIYICIYIYIHIYIYIYIYIYIIYSLYIYILSAEVKPVFVSFYSYKHARMHTHWKRLVRC